MLKLHIPGMTCGGCARRVRAAILALDPAAEIAAQPPSREITVQTTAGRQPVLAVLEEAGYPASMVEEAD